MQGDEDDEDAPVSSPARDEHKESQRGEAGPSTGGRMTGSRFFSVYEITSEGKKEKKSRGKQ
jgi:hypothetical protein